jgi:hypothetical protein
VLNNADMSRTKLKRLELKRGKAWIFIILMDSLLKKTKR